MTPAPKRRWFHISLLCVALMVVFGWLEYQIRWIRQRHAFIARDEMEFNSRFWQMWHEVQTRLPEVSPLDAPKALWIFGERGRDYVTVLVESESSGTLTANDKGRIQEAKGLFPEAVVATIHIRRHEGKRDTLGVNFTAAPLAWPVEQVAPPSEYQPDPSDPPSRFYKAKPPPRLSPP